jgi:hypothetical protein
MDIDEIYKDLTCIYCKRKHSESRINIEGVIHHNCYPQCIDIRECRKYSKKKSKERKKNKK